MTSSIHFNKQQQYAFDVFVHELTTTIPKNVFFDVPEDYVYCLN